MTTVRAQSETDVANLALNMLGQSPIGALSDNIHRARVMNQNFGSARDAVLAMYDWPFASQWCYPTLSPVAAAGPKVNRLVMPADCLKVVSLRNPLTGEAYYDDDYEGNETGGWDIISAVTPGVFPLGTTVIAINLKQQMIPPATTFTPVIPQVLYRQQIVNPALWNPDFVLVFADKLAAMSAARILRDPAAAKEMNKAADEAIFTAAQRSARETSPKHVTRNTSWVQARNVWGPWPGGGGAAQGSNLPTSSGQNLVVNPP